MKMRKAIKIIAIILAIGFIIAGISYLVNIDSTTKSFNKETARIECSIKDEKIILKRNIASLDKSQVLNGQSSGRGVFFLGIGGFKIQGNLTQEYNYFFYAVDGEGWKLDSVPANQTTIIERSGVPYIERIKTKIGFEQSYGNYGDWVCKYSEPVFNIIVPPGSLVQSFNP